MNFELSDEQAELARTVRAFAETELAAGAFAEARPSDFVRERARRFAQLGLTGISLPPEDGGQGGSLLDSVIALREVARVCPHSGDVVQAYNFGGIRQVQVLGSVDLKERILRPALSGDLLISLAMSEPDAGSGLANIRTSAAIIGDSVVINGAKIFATHGVDADVIIVWCRFGPEPREIGAVVVPSDSPGFRRGKTERFMSGESYCEMQFDDCTVPAANILAKRDAIRTLMPVFNVERLGNATRAFALATRAFELAAEHVAHRRVGGERLSDLQGIRWKFADMRMRLDASELMLFRAAAWPGGPSDAVTASTKCFINEAAFFVANEALQVFGGYGYSTEYPLEYIFRRVRGWMIAGGTTEILRNRIAHNVFKTLAAG